MEGNEEFNWFIPGPTQVRPEILSAMSRQPVGHRSQDYVSLQARVVKRAQRLFKTNQDVFLSTSSASGLFEAAILSCVESKSLHFVNGEFSDRWYKAALALGKKAVKVEVDWGEAISPDLVREYLVKDDYEAVFFTHCETSTGVMNPLSELAAVVKQESQALVMADVVSTLAGAPVFVDDWQLDVCLASVQKCLALPPGFSLVAVSNKALEKATQVSNRGMYGDFLVMKKYHDRDNTLMTPSIPHMYALDRQLEYIMDEEGLEQRWQRHTQMQDLVASWAISHGLEYFSDENYLSPTVSCISNVHDWPIGELIKAVCLDSGYVFGNGYGHLKERAFRIGHMGDHTMQELEELLAAIGRNI